MNKAEIINTLYKGEFVKNQEIYDYCKDYFTPSNIRLLIKKFIVLSNTIDYDYLKNPESVVLLVDFGRLAAIYDLLTWSVLKDGVNRDISKVAWRREVADFLTETPETLNSLNHVSLDETKNT